MTAREISMLLLVAGSSMVWGAETKESLNDARSQYRQAVNAHGPQSPEAREARQNLRNTRHNFHQERRERARRR